MSESELATVSISCRESLIMLRAVSSVKACISADIGRVISIRSFININQSRGESMPPCGQERFNCLCKYSPLTDMSAWRLHKNDATKCSRTIKLYEIMQYCIMPSIVKGS